MWDCSAHPSIPKSQSHAATSALSQPAQDLATFAPPGDGTAATRSFPDPTPRDPSPAEHTQHLPLSHAPCTQTAHIVPALPAPLWPGGSCKAAATLR